MLPTVACFRCVRCCAARTSTRSGRALGPWQRLLCSSHSAPYRDIDAESRSPSRPGESIRTPTRGEVQERAFKVGATLTHACWHRYRSRYGTQRNCAGAPLLPLSALTAASPSPREPRHRKHCPAAGAARPPLPVATATVRGVGDSAPSALQPIGRREAVAAGAGRLGAPAQTPFAAGVVAVYLRAALRRALVDAQSLAVAFLVEGPVAAAAAGAAWRTAPFLDGADATSQQEPQQRVSYDDPRACIRPQHRRPQSHPGACYPLRGPPHSHRGHWRPRCRRMGPWQAPWQAPWLAP